MSGSIWILGLFIISGFYFCAGVTTESFELSFSWVSKVSPVFKQEKSSFLTLSLVWVSEKVSWFDGTNKDLHDLKCLAIGSGSTGIVMISGMFGFFFFILMTVYFTSFIG